MSRTRWMGLMVVVALLASVPAAAARKPPTPGKRIAAAQQLVKKLPRTSFARNRRGPLLKAIAGARRGVKRHRTCAAVRSTDRARNALLTKTTWKHGRIPRQVKRRIAPGLAKAEKTLVRKAGKKCARPVKTSKKLKPHKGGSGLKPLEPLRAEENGQGEDEDKRIPAGKYRPLKTPGQTTGLGADPHLGGGTPSARSPRGREGEASPFGELDVPPLNFFVSSDVGTPGRTAEPQEPSTAVGGGVAWFTGNSSVGYSLDGGTSWTRVDPSTILPDPSGEPFCCDQLVSYSPQANLFVWVMQYWCQKGSSSPASNNCNTSGTGANRIRIAVASPQDLRKDKNNIGAAWTYWDLPPSLFGFPATSWFDRSDISVNSTFLNWTVDVLRGASGSLLARVPLYQLQNRGTITISWINDTPQRMTTAQGTGTSWTYFAGANSLSQARLWEWAPNSGTLFRHDIDHSSVPINNGAINGTNGGNWYGRWGIFPGAVESAAWVGNHLIVAQGAGRDQCTDKCNTGSPTTTHVFDRDPVYISRFDTNSWKLSSERWLWNPTLNFAWPFLAVAGDGSVGITFLTSPDNANPQPVAGFLNEEQFVYALGAGQPQGGGDYYTLRPGRTASSFVIPVRSNEVDADGVTRTHWRYIEYGHGSAPSRNAPSVFITAPKEGRTFTAGSPITFNATASDIEDGVVPEYAIVWRVDGVQIGTGSRLTYASSSPGSHTATVTATDGTGLSTTATVHYTVLNPGGPTVSILSPDDGQTYYAEGDEGDGEYKDLPITATASDPNGKPLTYQWTDSINGGPATVVSTALSPTLRLHVTGHNCGFATHDLTLTVSNGTQSVTASITEGVRTALCIK